MRDETIKIYLKLKQLMYEIDDIHESSDEEGNKPSKRESTKTVRGHLAFRSSVNGVAYRRDHKI